MGSTAPPSLIDRALHDAHALREAERGWLDAIRRYLIAIAAGNFLWETAQLPLYTLWDTGTFSQIAGAVFHCTLGDVIIAAVALVIALVLFASPGWPHASFGKVLCAAIVVGVGYTIYSEYANTTLRAAWTYSTRMPTLPWFGTGLAPFMQWIIVPMAAFASALRVKRRDI